MRLTPSEVAAPGFVAKPSERRSAQVLSRFGGREHGPAFWAALWAAAAVAEVAALVPVIRDTPRPLEGPDLVFLLAAGSFMACGLIAWRRRPDNHSGRLMTATGFGALVYPLLSQLDGALAATLGMQFYSVWTIGYVALLLTFMTGGRLESRVDRALVGVFTLALVVAQLVWMLFLEFDAGRARRNAS